MAHTEQQPAARAKLTPSDDAFEEVRQSFLMRLPGEQARLLVLTDALGSGKGNTALVLGDLEIFAHRLRGAAAVFDANALSEDAKSLELAVAAASIAPIRDNDTFVWATLRTLTSRLASMNGTQLPADCAVSTAQ
jgi:HPt (histidine-containing phosphotransfer) domain-containing protein